ncbi:unnamed protein product [Vitrella brassicaformis CCMP3155]|uniref:FAM86 N-terminal domain-containing protein n=1 Tax=Vitrella brassicaformis (strain CCMP3155) TaxID=1169540 RepID=A0A0G4G3U6_VITBC|nr:unnamed protein product [Vitrella brassicaformis CCMP3155]|eukprot:CEM22842.1 unnamed protein product [Vitrella brassicaformis CCMP3155]
MSQRLRKANRGIQSLFEARVAEICEREKGGAHVQGEDERAGGVGDSEYLYSTLIEGKPISIIIKERLRGCLWHEQMAVSPAAEVFCKFIELHPILFQGKTVLELGAGCGLCSIVASLCNANVTATDRPKVVASLLRANIKSATKQALLQNIATEMEVKELLWGSELREEGWGAKGFESFDYVIATDVATGNDVFESLLVTVLQLAGPKTIILLAHVWRNEEVEKRFFQRLKGLFKVRRACNEEHLQGIKDMLNLSSVDVKLYAAKVKTTIKKQETLNQLALSQCMSPPSDTRQPPDIRRRFTLVTGGDVTRSSRKSTVFELPALSPPPDTRQVTSLQQLLPKKGTTKRLSTAMEVAPFELPFQRNGEGNGNGNDGGAGRKGSMWMRAMLKKGKEEGQQRLLRPALRDALQELLKEMKAHRYYFEPCASFATQMCLMLQMKRASRAAPPSIPSEDSTGRSRAMSGSSFSAPSSSASVAQELDPSASAEEEEPIFINDELPSLPLMLMDLQTSIQFNSPPDPFTLRNARRLILELFTLPNGRSMAYDLATSFLTNTALFVEWRRVLESFQPVITQPNHRKTDTAENAATDTHTAAEKEKPSAPMQPGETKDTKDSPSSAASRVVGAVASGSVQQQHNGHVVGPDSMTAQQRADLVTAIEHIWARVNAMVSFLEMLFGELNETYAPMYRFAAVRDYALHLFLARVYSPFKSEIDFTCAHPPFIDGQQINIRNLMEIRAFCQQLLDQPPIGQLPPTRGKTPPRTAS